MQGVRSRRAGIVSVVCDDLLFFIWDSTLLIKEGGVGFWNLKVGKGGMVMVMVMDMMIN